MKTKYLFTILCVVLVLFAYNLFCYSFVNRVIKDKSRKIIKNYFVNNNQNINYEYKMATYNHETDTIQIFVSHKENDKEMFYRFVVIQNGTGFQLIDVNQDIPAYIR